MSEKSAVARWWSGLKEGIPRLVRDPSLRSRSFIVLAAIFVCAYALGVVAHVMTMPDMGVRTAFSTDVHYFYKDFLVQAENEDRPLRPNDRILTIGDSGPIKDWPHLLRTQAELERTEKS